MIKDDEHNKIGWKTVFRKRDLETVQDKLSMFANQTI